MERAEARKLQPHFIRSFFLTARTHLGGAVREREPGRFEIGNVPAELRRRDRQIGTGAPLLRRYERVTFEKDLIAAGRGPAAEYVTPGHPLLDGTIDLIVERYGSLLHRSAVERAALDAVIAIERARGHDPVELPPNDKGYDIESRAANGSLLFLEVKGRRRGAETFTVTRSEVGVGRNLPDQHILALAEISATGFPDVRYIRGAFQDIGDLPFDAISARQDRHHNCRRRQPVAGCPARRR